MIKNITVLLIGFIVALGCKSNPKETHEFLSEDNGTVDGASPAEHPGKKLMEVQCYICHSPSAPEKEGRIGPPMVAIKAHYIDEDTTQEEFLKALWEFVEQPTVEKAKLRGAISRFGIMPYQSFKKEEIEQIGAYLFEYQIEEPIWFKEHWKGRYQRRRYINTGKKTASNRKLTNGEIGLNYALNTKKELGKNLMGTIQKSGALAAVPFCNKRAYPLTDSMAIAQNAIIKRVSDKPRNKNNQASPKELKIIASFKKSISNNDAYAPVVEETDGKVHFFYPITINSMCLQCHGKAGKDITPKVLTTLKELYPEDKAIGYEINEVRGIWSITFPRGIE